MLIWLLESHALQRYSNHDIVNFLESIGASFGACQNAYTSADETVYTLMVPTADTALLDKSIAVLSEFAARIRYVRLRMCLLQINCSAV
jgi:predicted Zn-dependent peptidase